MALETLPPSLISQLVQPAADRDTRTAPANEAAHARRQPRAFKATDASKATYSRPAVTRSHRHHSFSEDK